MISKSHSKAAPPQGHFVTSKPSYDCLPRSFQRHKASSNGRHTSDNTASLSLEKGLYHSCAEAAGEPGPCFLCVLLVNLFPPKCFCMILNDLKQNCVFDHVFVGQEEDVEAYISMGNWGVGVGRVLQTTIKCSKTGKVFCGAFISPRLLYFLWLVNFGLF